MRNNSKDRTVERNYIQKWRFLVREYELVKAKKHPRFCPGLLQLSWHQPSDLCQVLQPLSDRSLLPLKRPRWKSRRTLPFIEQKVLELRLKGINRYEIYGILHPELKSHTPAPLSTP